MMKNPAKNWSQINFIVNTYIKPQKIGPMLIFLNLIISLYLATQLNIWVDEAYSLATTGKDISYALNQAIKFELQPPLYFLILNIWRSINNSIIWARLFSVFCITATIYLVPKLSQRYLKEIHPNWVMAFVAFNPFIFWAALEIRVYAFGTLLSALLLLLFYDGYLAENPHNKAQLWYIFVAILSLYTQYYLGFLLCANGCVILYFKRWHSLRNYVIAMTIVGIAFLPMLFYVKSQVSEHTQTVQINVSFFQAIKYFSRKAIGLLFRAEWIPDQQRDNLGFYIVISMVAITLGFQTYKNRRFITNNDITLLIINFVIAIFLITLILKIIGDLLNTRHIYLMYLPLVFMLYSLLRLVNVFGRKNLIRFLSIWTVITLIFNISSLYFIYKPMAKSGDYNRVASYLMAYEKPNQPILTFNSELALPLSHYYVGKNQIVPIPKAENFIKFDLQDFVLYDEKEIFESIAKIGSDGKNIWLFTDGICAYLNVNYNCEILDNFVTKYYTEKLQINFYRSSLKFLERK